MKTYTIFSSSEVGNNFLLSRPGLECFTTTEENIAREIYAKEVKALSATYRQDSDLDCSPTYHEMRNAIICKMFVCEYCYYESGDEVHCWIEEVSDYFYDENF